MSFVTIDFHPSGRSVRVEAGLSLASVAEAAGIELRVPCGGRGRCGKCKVIFEEGAPTPTPTELEQISEAEIAQGCRLACQAIVNTDAVVYVADSIRPAKILTVGTVRDVPFRPAVSKKCAVIPAPESSDCRSDLTRVLDILAPDTDQSEIHPSALVHLGEQVRRSDSRITGVFYKGHPIAFEPGDTTAECVGVAVDIGTTTLAVYLLDLNTGQQISVEAGMNPQASVGDDVISRISYVMNNSDGLSKLRHSVISAINGLLADLAQSADIPLENFYDVTVVGNTCMLHLFLGIDPRYLATAPYVPVINSSVHMRAYDSGLDINPLGHVHVLPGIAGYVGADTTAVILSSALHQEEALTLAVDIGTNGEIVLGSSHRMVACSTAAGPAFEGAHIRHGMRAAAGAIDAVWLDDGEIAFSTIGGSAPVGICGSGLLDAVVCLMKAGIIEPSGRIVDSEEAPARVAERIRSGEHGNEYVLATADRTQTGLPIVITQRDVREVQLAKGAIAAGIHTLIGRLGVSVEDIERVILAGAFGNYLRKESAIAVGMIPALPISKIHSVGNAAGEGAKAALISLDARAEADEIVRRIEYVELTTDLGFQERFADALVLGPVS